jgi:Xaa-Pro dipeptidase
MTDVEFSSLIFEEKENNKLSLSFKFLIATLILISFCFGLSTLFLILHYSHQKHQSGCQTTFNPVNDTFLREMHQTIRTKFFQNSAFQTSVSSFSTKHFTSPTSNDNLPSILLHQSHTLYQRSFTRPSDRSSSLSSSIQQTPLLTGAIYLEGTKTTTRAYSDTELPFIQESNFLYLSGVNKPDCLFLLDIATQSSYLFVPQYDDYYAVWVGVVLSLSQLQELYGVNYTFYLQDFENVLSSLSQQNPTEYKIYTLPDASTERFATYPTDNTTLKPILYEERSLKTNDEIHLLRIAALVSSDAHLSSMTYTHEGLYEYSISTHFAAYLGECGIANLAYETIVGAGIHAGILHYTAKTAKLLQNQLLLIDAGGQYCGYTSDITRTYPVGGVFSPEQRELYIMVLNIQTKCINMISPGIPFTDIRRVATELVCDELIANDFVYGDTSTCVELGIFALFMPHGLGHFIGLDVHDTTIYPENLLLTNMILTIEPGIYFNSALLLPAMNATDTRSSLLNHIKIQQYLDMEIGGVRIEDDILVVDSGYEVISNAPKTLSEIEKVMAK